MRNPEYEGTDLLHVIREAEHNSVSTSSRKKMIAQAFQGLQPIGTALAITTETGHSPTSIQALGNISWRVQEIVDQNQDLSLGASDMQNQSTRRGINVEQRDRAYSTA